MRWQTGQRGLVSDKAKVAIEWVEQQQSGPATSVRELTLIYFSTLCAIVDISS